MDSSKAQAVVRINLTPSQAQEIKAITGIAAEAIQMTAEELEQRIAPSIFVSQPIVPPSDMLAANSNESMLAD
jgi:hypothetical protein